MPVFSSDDQHVLFAHVPKTGGTAIETAFARSGFEVAHRDAAPPNEGARVVRRCSPQHWHADLLAELLVLDAFAVSFTIVRDPVGRFRSEFAHRQRGSGRDREPGTVERWGLRMLRRQAEEPYWKDNHFRPQHEFVTPGMRVFRYEDGLSAVLDALRADGVAVTARLPVLNAAGSSSSDVPVTDRLRAALVEHYRDDYERFGYPVR